MVKITDKASLQQEIERLKNRQTEQETAIKESLGDIRTSLRPMNLLKKGAGNLIRDKAIVSNIAGTAVEILLGTLMAKPAGALKFLKLAGITAAAAEIREIVLKYMNREKDQEENSDKKAE